MDRYHKAVLKPDTPPDPPSAKTVIRYVSEHSNFLRKKPKILEDCRIRCFNKDVVSSFFNLYNDLMEKNHYNPNYIFNIDETSIKIKLFNLPKVIVTKDSPTPVVKMPKKFFTSTAIFITSSGGLFLHPRYIFANPPWKDELKDQKLFHCKYYSNSSGYITKELFAHILLDEKEGIINEINHYLGERNPEKDRVLLILDGHSSRSNPALMEACAKACVDVLCLPAHTSHGLQPNDASVNARFKQELRNVRHFPTSSFDDETKLFLRDIYNASHLALSPTTIQDSWESTLDKDKAQADVLNSARSVTEQEKKQPPRRTSFICGKVLTDPLTLLTWPKKRRRSPKTKEKSNKVEPASKQSAQEKTKSLDTSQTSSEEDEYHEDLTEEEREEDDDTEAERPTRMIHRRPFQHAKSDFVCGDSSTDEESEDGLRRFNEDLVDPCGGEQNLDRMETLEMEFIQSPQTHRMRLQPSKHKLVGVRAAIPDLASHFPVLQRIAKKPQPLRLPKVSPKALHYIIAKRKELSKQTLEPKQQGEEGIDKQHPERESLGATMARLYGVPSIGGAVPGLRNPLQSPIFTSYLHRQRLSLQAGPYPLPVVSSFNPVAPAIDPLSTPVKDRKEDEGEDHILSPVH